MIAKTQDGRVFTIHREEASSHSNLCITEHNTPSTKDRFPEVFRLQGWHFYPDVNGLTLTGYRISSEISGTDHTHFIRVVMFFTEVTNE